MRFLLLSLLVGHLLALPTAAQTLPAPKDTVATRYQLPGADCALFPAAAAFPENKLGDIYELGMQRFTPTQEQVYATEQLLKAIRLDQVSYRYEFTDYYDNYPAIIKKNLANYKRQYYGFYNAAHHACLFINFFTEYKEEIHPPLYWLHHPVRVYDGGWAFWSIYYDLTDKKFFLYEHNSEG